MFMKDVGPQFSFKIFFRFFRIYLFHFFNIRILLALK